MNNDVRAHFSKEDIGGDLLPILTRGLYRDTLDALREYIQNAIDAKSTQIQVSVDPDIVSVLDNGSGMGATDARNAIRLGISEKNPLVNVGFRGIGIYSGFNLCDLLEIYTKTSNDSDTYRLAFNFDQIRRELLAEQERRNLGMEPEVYLEKLLEDFVFVELAEDGIIEDHGTRVVMSGLLPDSYSRLNDWDQVEEYLQNVVPLPFHPEFKWGGMIEERFKEEDHRVVPLTLEIGDRSLPIFRPYTDRIFKFGGNHPPEFFDVKDTRQSFGFAWVCVNDARETIKDVNVRGLLIKKFGFSIADRRYLEPYFVRTVYSRRITGEVIVNHPNLIPNAARSDFENNLTRQTLLESLPKLTRAVDRWANKIQEEDRAREVLSTVARRLTDINSELLLIQRDKEKLLVLNAELAGIGRSIKTQTRRLRSVDPSGLEKANELYGGIQKFVREVLFSQRRSRRNLEEEIVRSVQRESLTPTEDEDARNDSAPADLVALLDMFGMLENEEMRRFILVLDDQVLKTRLDASSYKEIIGELQDHLEENT